MNDSKPFLDEEQQRRAENVKQAKVSLFLSGYHQSEFGDFLSQKYIDGEITTEEQVSILHAYYGIEGNEEGEKWLMKHGIQKAGRTS